MDLYTTEESDFYGLFNTLLFELFPTPERYPASPEFKHVEGSLDFTIQFIVRRRVPVVFINVKTLRSLKALSARDGADDQMRRRFHEFTVSTPTLYGLSSVLRLLIQLRR
jgi:hypothetical protein